ncbi:DUF4097 family beta strand repeat-containing protein [Bacillus sp. NPDC077027]|uniref:DUF4097 family beta strand repeat-containing protein n=1 Tax=Bacillus sp. NPDC077027 TaxID=3390548 RepID=UPI003CFE2906
MKHTVRIEEVVSDLSIDWLTGKIHIYQHDQPDILVHQITSNSFPERYLFDYQLREGTLLIQDGRQRRMSIGFHLHRTDLDIYLPKRIFNSFSIHSKGAHLFTNDMDVEHFKAQLTSGKAVLSGNMKNLFIHAVGCHISGGQLFNQKLNVQTTSSRVDLSGEFSDIHVNSTARRIHITSSTMLNSLHSISTGASVHVVIPDNNGFTCRLKKVSGAFQNEFISVAEKGKYVYKDGLKLFDIEIRGGKFRLSKTR